MNNPILLMACLFGVPLFIPLLGILITITQGGRSALIWLGCLIGSALGGLAYFGAGLGGGHGIGSILTPFYMGLGGLVGYGGVCILQRVTKPLYSPAIVGLALMFGILPPIGLFMTAPTAFFGIMGGWMGAAIVMFGIAYLVIWGLLLLLANLSEKTVFGTYKFLLSLLLSFFFLMPLGWFLSRTGFRISEFVDNISALIPAGRFSIKNFQESPITMQGFTGPVGWKIEFDLYHPSINSGFVVPPQLMLTSAHGTIGDGYQILGSNAYDQLILTINPLGNRNSETTLNPKQKQTHITYSLYPAFLRNAESANKICVEPEYGKKNPTLAPSKPDQMNLTAYWYAGLNRRKIVNLDDLIMTTLKTQSRLAHDPKLWTSIGLAFHPRNLETLGYKPEVSPQKATTTKIDSILSSIDTDSMVYGTCYTPAGQNSSPQDP